MGEDNEVRSLLIQCKPEIQAVSVLVNEALSMVLSLDDNPDQSFSIARKDVEEMAARAERVAAGDKGLTDTQQWFFQLVQASLKRKLDAIEKGVSTLMKDRPTH